MHLAFKQMSYPVFVLKGLNGAITINSVNSYSMDPLMVSFNLYHRSRVLPIDRVQLYGLQKEHVSIAKHFEKHSSGLEMPSNTFQLEGIIQHQWHVADHLLCLMQIKSHQFPSVFSPLLYSKGFYE